MPVNKKYIETKNNKLFRGQSRNQIVIACAIDKENRKYAQIVGKGHITSKECIESYGKAIEKGSYIIHDGIFSHDALIRYLESQDEVWKSTSKESKKHLQPINSFSAEIKRCLTVHIGLRSENLQDYLNWIVFRSTLNSQNIEEKLEELEALCYKFHYTYRLKDRY